jgi:hypothetical protein
MAGLQAAAHWSTVVDFRWHKSTASPNCHEIPVSIPVPLPAQALAGAHAGATTVKAATILKVTAVDEALQVSPPNAGNQYCCPPPPCQPATAPAEKNDEF